LQEVEQDLLAEARAFGVLAVALPVLFEEERKKRREKA
jgi:hypothetical protein